MQEKRQPLGEQILSPFYTNLFYKAGTGYVFHAKKNFLSQETTSHASYRTMAVGSA